MLNMLMKVTMTLTRCLLLSLFIMLASYWISVKVFGTIIPLDMPQKEYESASPEVVQIGRYCTGFVVGKNLVATARHCINTKNHKGVTVTFSNREESKFFLLKSGLDKQTDDWAILTGFTGNRVPVILQDEPTTGFTFCYFTGHGGGRLQQHTSGCAVNNNPLFPFEGFYTLYSMCIGGYSGSPVYDLQTGGVFGIVTRKYDGLAITLAIETKNLKKALKELNDVRRTK